MTMVAASAQSVEYWPRYSWIAHQLDIGTPSYFLLSRSNVASETSLNSSTKTTQGMLLGSFATPQNMLIWLVATFWCFLGGFRHSIGPLRSKPLFSESELLYAYYVRKSSSPCMQNFDNFSKMDVSYYIVFARTRKHSIIEHTHNSFTSLKKLKKTIYQQTKAPQKDHGAWRRGERPSVWARDTMFESLSRLR